MPEALLGRHVQVSDMTQPAAPLLGFVKEPWTSLQGGRVPRHPWKAALGDAAELCW